MTPTQLTTDPLIADPFYQSLKGFIIRASGLNYYLDKDEDLAGRIQRRLSILGLHDCSSYLNLLRDPAMGRAELDEMIAEVTIGETYFFRHSEHFDALRNIVLPNLITRNQEKKSLRIWCAGCSDGPEAYSIAILLAREMADQLTNWNIRILATDINRHSLKRAREGRFSEWAFRATTDEVKQECFVKEGSSWRIDPRYKQWISFEHFNLISDSITTAASSLLPLDLIICRNVMIYFDADVTCEIVQRFHSCLAYGGWLLVGPAEPNMKSYKSFATVNAPGVTLYQKRLQEKAPERVSVSFDIPPMVSATSPRARPAQRIIKTKKPPPVTQPAEPTLDDVRRHADCGDWAGAIQVCEQLLKKDSLKWQTQFYHALVLDHMGRREEAEAGLRKAVYLERQSAVPHYYLGLLLHSTGKPREATRFFANALELLESRSDAETFTEADGITVAEMKKLAKMHLDVLASA